MINNLPEPNEFKSLSVQYLVQAIDHILKTELALSPGFLLYDLDDLDEEWESRQGVLGNSLIMLFLSIENFFKHSVCSETPNLLLTEDSQRHLHTLEAVDFEDLYIVGLDELIVKYQEIDGKSLSGSALGTLEELRVRRNKFTHGLHREIIKPDYIIQSIAVFLSEIWGTSWISEFREVMLTEPLYGLFGEEEENMQLLQYFKFLEKYLSKRKFKNLIGMPQEGRRYICPHCQDNAIESGELLEANYANLEPNSSSSTEIHCWLCHGYAKVERVQCSAEACPANVIYPADTDKIHTSITCLTCGLEQGN